MSKTQTYIVNDTGNLHDDYNYAAHDSDEKDRNKTPTISDSRKPSIKISSVNLQQPMKNKRVSIFQMYRYASIFDILMVIVGICVAVATGLGFPFLATILGDVSQSFIDYEAFRNEYQSNFNFTDLEVQMIKSEFNHRVVTGCLKYTYVGLGVFASSFIQVTCFVKSCENITHKLRKKFFQAILRQDVAYFDMHQSGNLATTLFDNLERVREGLGDKMGLTVQFVSQFFGGLVIALTYNWKLTLIMMSLSPFMIICGAFIARLMASSAAKEAEKYAEAGAIAEETLTSIRTVLAFNGQNKEFKKYDSALQAGMKDGIKRSFIIGFGLAATFIVMFSSFCLAFWVGTDYVYWKLANSAKVLTVFFSVLMGSMALGQAGPQFAAVGTAFGAGAAIFDVIDRIPEIDSYSDKGKKPKNIKGKIEVKNVTFRYPTRPELQILKGISFICEPGQTVAIVGSSGCGKSTLVSLLLRFYNPESGELTIDDIPIQDINIEHLRNIVGVVNQEPMLFNTSILENMKYGNPDASEKQIYEALRKSNALTFVNSFPEGLHTLVGDRGAQMSGGQKQRIAIARALVRDPKVLLLDEATSALDADSESIVQEALENASAGRTTIVIAHRLSTIQNADKIVAMKHGKIIEVGTHDELLAKKGLYFELVNAQVFADVEKEKKDMKSEKTKVTRRGTRSSTILSADQSIDAEDFDKKDDKQSDLDRLKKELELEGAVEANLFKILPHAKPETGYLIFGTINACVQGCVFPFFSICFTELMNVFALETVDPEKMRRHGHYWALGFLVLAAVQGITMIGQCSMYGIAAERLTRRLRAKVFNKILQQDGYFFDMPSHSPGKITTRLATDAPTVRSAIDYRLGTVLNALVSMCCGLGIAFYYGWQMALLMLGMVPVMGFAQAVHVKMFEGSAAQHAKETETAGKVAMEAIEAIRTVQSLTLERRLHTKFCYFLAGPHSSAFLKALVQGLTFAIANSIYFFALAAEFRFGAYLISSNHVQNPMNILRVLFAIQFSAQSIGFASAYFPEYIKAKFAAGLIFKMLGDEPHINPKSGTKPNINGSIEFKQLHFTYPQRPEVQILQGLDISVSPGETLALVGPSGCGKSTLVALLERFYDPVKGEVIIDGTNLKQISVPYLRSQVSLVSQEPILFDTTIKENILYGLESTKISDSQIVEACKKANIHNFISNLPAGYDTRAGDKGTQLSGGQKQRIAIARALIRNPKILLLDEATSALDTESEKIVQEALDAASAGRTCIVIAHRLSTIINANVIAVVKDGRIVEKGTHTELMKLGGAYYNLTIKQQIRHESD